MVSGRSKAVFTTWLQAQTPDFRAGIESVAMDPGRPVRGVEGPGHDGDARHVGHGIARPPMGAPARSPREDRGDP